MKIAIVGSRTYGNMRAVREYVNKLPKDTIVISGGAEGVDSFAVKVAEERGLKTMVFPAEWKKYGKSAGMIRNLKMAKEADKIVAFWDGYSVGTKHMIEACKKAGKPLDIKGDTLSYEHYPAGYSRGILGGGKRVRAAGVH